MEMKYKCVFFIIIPLLLLFCGSGALDDDDTDDDHKSSDGAKMFNFASHAAGAVVLDFVPSSAKGYSNLLTDDKDKYGISPCNEKKWVVIGLSEDIMITSVVLANYEKYSSMLKDFQLQASNSYPTDVWIDLGTYTAEPKLGEQMFNITNPSAHTRYLKVRFKSHYDNDALCTLSQIKVHGMTVIASFKQEVEWSDSERRDILQQLSSEIKFGEEDTGEVLNQTESELVATSEPSVEDSLLVAEVIKEDPNTEPIVPIESVNESDKSEGSTEAIIPAAPDTEPILLNATSNEETADASTVSELIDKMESVVDDSVLDISNSSNTNATNNGLNNIAGMILNLFNLATPPEKTEEVVEEPVDHSNNATDTTLKREDASSPTTVSDSPEDASTSDSPTEINATTTTDAETVVAVDEKVVEVAIVEPVIEQVESSTISVSDEPTFEGAEANTTVLIDEVPIAIDVKDVIVEATENSSLSTTVDSVEITMITTELEADNITIDAAPTVVVEDSMLNTTSATVDVSSGTVAESIAIVNTTSVLPASEADIPLANELITEASNSVKSVSVTVSMNGGGLPLMNCYDTLKLSEFKAKMIAKLQKSNSSMFDESIPVAPTTNKDNNNVFRILMQRIKALEIDNAIMDMYVIQLTDCYRSVTKEILSSKILLDNMEDAKAHMLVVEKLQEAALFRQNSTQELSTLRYHRRHQDGYAELNEYAMFDIVFLWLRCVFSGIECTDASLITQDYVDEHRTIMVVGAMLFSVLSMSASAVICFLVLAGDRLKTSQSNNNINKRN